MKLTIILFLLFTQATAAFSNTLKDSVSKPTSIPDSITNKIEEYIHQAIIHSAENPALAIKNYRSAIIANPIKGTAWEADVRTQLGKLLFRIKSKDALPQLLKADAIYKKHKSLTGRADALSIIALIQEMNGLWAEAEKTYNVLYKLQDNLNEAVLAGNAALRVFDYYLSKKNYDLALKYSELAHTAYYKVCRKDSLASLYFKIAQIKRKQNSPNVAAFYITNKALPFYSATNDLAGRMRSFNFLGHLYQDQKRLSEAKWFYIQANSLSRTLNDTATTITSLISMSIVKMAIGDKALAKRDLTEADFLARQGKFTHLMKGVKLKYPAMFKAPAKAIPFVSASMPVGTESQDNRQITPFIYAEFINTSFEAYSQNSSK
ncbi:MAG: hypothetical protein H7Y07_01545 [Pyrinomonadaceae bacterium]|nr:hypothetical protein [Sphingobacteriaceae bacterium]